MVRIVIVDGYVDEPTCLGVPPYMSMYPRYISGSILTHAPRTDVVYQTIDQVRVNLEKAHDLWASSDIIILIAGMIVPGKYLGGTPISIREAKQFFSGSRIDEIPKLLVGPWARFGCGLEGGHLALSSAVLSPPFTDIVTGDAEVVIGELVKNDWNLSSVNLNATRQSAQEIEEYVMRGTSLVTQFPGFSKGYIICEIETYRGCPRFFTGGCSFCTEPLYGIPQVRRPNDIIKEIESLYAYGVRAFRIGRQADLFTYGSKEMGDEEFPTPNPSVVLELFSGIRQVAPQLNVLHIDNVNPGTIAHHQKESREVAKIIMKYHTPGDVAAFGVESLDPEVRKRNNLKVSEDEAYTAVRILNEVGAIRPKWGLPHLLPGINLLYGLDGERKQTVDYNMEFLQRLVDDGLMVRRINVRQVIGFPNTTLDKKKPKKLKRNLFFKHKEEIREKIDKVMIERVAPSGTVIESLFVEKDRGKSVLLRPLGTYPLQCQMPTSDEDMEPTFDVVVTQHGPRSLTVLPYPLPVNDMSLSQWRVIPGLGSKLAARIKGEGRIESEEHLERIIEKELPSWIKHKLTFR